MKSLKFKYILVAICALVLFTTACDTEDFLDNENKSNLTDVTQWASEGNADIYLNDIYSELPGRARFSEQLDYYTDDYNISHYYTASNWRQGVCQAPSGSTGGSWWGTHGPTDGLHWSTFFTKLRKCNTFIQKLDEYKENFSDDWYNMRIDEAKFMRAYLYSEFFMHIGGLPIIEVPLDRNTMTEDEMLFPRSSFKETFEWIDNELNTIVNNGNLPVKYSSGDGDAGRVTIGAALAVKGWIELFVASPLFNTSNPYLADPDGLVHMGSYDASLWTKAAATNKQFITSYGGGAPYGLFSDAKNLFRAANEYSSEIIWDRQYLDVTGMGSNYEKRGGPTYVLGQYMCWGNYNPTQEVVDAYCMANGKEITDPESGYDPQNPYVGREQRFYNDIAFDGAEYKLDWMSETDVIYTRIDETYANPDKTNQIDLAGKTDVGDSGYYQRKRLNPDAPPGNHDSGQNYIYYRYAEILLNFAEAQNEATGPNADVYAAINELRARVELPALEEGLSKDEMREAIWRERRVELSFENKRYMDNKRWAIAEQIMGTQRHNMVIRNSVPADNSGVWVYSIEEEAKWTAKFEIRQYMSPIPTDAIDQNPNIKQNPGY